MSESTSYEINPNLPALLILVEYERRDPLTYKGVTICNFGMLIKTFRSKNPTEDARRAAVWCRENGYEWDYLLDADLFSIDSGIDIRAAMGTTSILSELLKRPDYVNHIPSTDP